MKFTWINQCFLEKKKEHMVCKLKRSIYGLKQPNFFRSCFSSLLERRGGFLAFISLKSPLSLFRLLRSRFSPLIKCFLPPDQSFYLIFLCFLMLLSPTCCGVWLFIGFFFMRDSNDNAASIKQKSHIKSLLVSMLHQTWNLRYSRHIRITSCAGLESFLLAINLDVMSSSNVFRSLIFMFRCKGITVVNQ